MHDHAAWRASRSGVRSWLRLGQPFTDPPDGPTEDGVALPTVLDDTTTDCAETVAGHDERARLGLVLDLPRPLAHRVCAPDAEQHFWVVAKMHQTRRFVDGPAAPALGTGRIIVLDCRSNRSHAAIVDPDRPGY
jgi:hypothetical protein